MTALRNTLLACALLASIAPAMAVTIDKDSIPADFEIRKVNKPEDARRCAAPRKLVVSDKCSRIGKGGRRCDLVCVGPNDSGSGDNGDS